MKLIIYKDRSDSRASKSEFRLTASPNTVRVKFGNEIVEISADAATDISGVQGNESAPNRYLEIKQQVHENYDASWVHLVLQKGRLFNQEYPDVPVLYDRGRFQLIAMAPDKAEQLVNSHQCFTVRPLENQSVVFDQHSRVQRLPRIPSTEQDLVDSVDKDRFLNILERLVGFHNRHSLSSNFTQVTHQLREILDHFGYETCIEPIEIFNRAGQFVGNSSNLVAGIPGHSPADAGLILVTAHLDSVNRVNQLDESLAAPGADDNGSGSAGAVEIAHVYSRFQGRHEIKFVLFGGEEQNLFGSRQYVENLTREEKSRILAVINMDMIGVRNSSPSTVLIEGAPVSRNVMQGLAMRAAAHTDLSVRTSENPFASDHVPFIDAEMPAVLTIEGDDGQNTSIHTPDDILESINPEYAEQILKMNVGYIASLMAG